MQRDDYFCEDIIESTGRGEPLPPRLSLSDEPEINENSSVPIYEQTHNVHRQAFGIDTPGECYNVNNGDYSFGFTDNASENFRSKTSDNHSSGKQMPDPSMTSLTVSALVCDKSPSQPASPYLSRHRFQRESQARVSDAEIVKERRKKLISMRQSSAMFGAGTSSVGNVTKSFGHVRKRHSSGKSFAKNVNDDHKEFAFGPVWLDGKDSEVKNLDVDIKSLESPDLRYARSIGITTESFGSKRNTIAAVHYQQIHSEKQPIDVASPRKRTIAPIGSLDDQIRHRKNHRKIRSQTLPEREIENEIKASPKLLRSATIQETVREESDETTSPEPESPKSPTASQILKEDPETKQAVSYPDIPRAISPESLKYSQSGSDMKSAFKRMRSRLNASQRILPPTSPLKPTRGTVVTSSPEETKDIRDRPSMSFSVNATVDEPRKRSGSFGSKMLRRAKSAVGKQSKKEFQVHKKDQKELNAESPSPARNLIRKQRSLNENLVHRVGSSPNDYSVMRQNTFDGSFFEDGSLFHGSDVSSFSIPRSSMNVVMQGDISRRRRMGWTKNWGVLTEDRILTLYKSKKDFEVTKKCWGLPTENQFDMEDKTGTIGNYSYANSPAPLSGIASVINLSGGCEIEDVEQGKKSTTFNLIPHSYQSFSHRGVTSTLPVDIDWKLQQKPIQLMCKNNDEFLYWVKAFYQLNTEERTGKKTEQRILTPILKPKSVQGENTNPQSQYQGRNQEANIDLGNWITNNRLVPGLDAGSMNGPVRQEIRSHQQKPVVKSESYQQASQHERDVHHENGVDFIPRKSSLDLDKIKFIDEDADEGDSSHGIRRSSDCTNVTTACEDISKTGNQINTDEFEDKGINIRRRRRKVRSAQENMETELKRCSITEKLDLRRAEIVEGNVSSDTPFHSDKIQKEVNHKVKSKSKYSKMPNNNENQGNVCISNLQDNGSKTSKAGQHQHNAHRKNERSSANIEHKTRDKKSVNEKHSRGRKNNLIGEVSDVREQTIGYMQPDKKGDFTSSNGAVYIGHLTGKENISSGVASEKNKHTNTVDEQCEIQNQNRENSKGLSDNESADEFLELKIEVNPEKVAKKETNKTATFIQPDLLSRNERHSIRQFKTRSGINKQKSLRQKLLRKLGPKVSLSNSTPDLNAAVENEINRDNNLLDLSNTEETDSPTHEIKLRRNTAFRNELKPPKTAQLTRCLSESDLLDAEEEVDGRNMRTFKNVRKLTQDTFMETYGVVPSKRNGKVTGKKQKRHSTIQDINKNDLPGFTLYVDENEYLEDITDKRRPSSSESSSGESSSYQASITTSEPPTPCSDIQKAKLSKSKSDNIHTVIRRPKSTGSEGSDGRHSAKESSRNSWIASLTPHFARKTHKESSTISASSKSSSGQASRKAVFCLPATNLTSAAHRGYLDRRNKKKQWDRFWCVLQDSCLYCYNSPQSEYTEDAVVLRGYDVIADVTNLNRTRFPFRLERNGSPTLHFSSDNHRDFLLWAGTLEKETSNVQIGSTDNEVLVNSVRSTTNFLRPESNQQPGEENTKPKTVESVTNKAPFETQKENLLREVLAHQHNYIEEEKLLQKKNVNAQISILPSATRFSKDQVNEKYSRAKEEEELKMLKCLTHLNKRRNSAQLKVDQITKQLAPKSGRKRRENPQQFAEMENKLKELQDRLAMVDKEIQEKQAMKQDVIEKMQQRRDLQLLILEQQDSLDIIHRHQAQKKRTAFAQQTQSQESNERLTSIDEMSTISDCSSTSSNSLPDHLTLPLESRTSSTPRQRRVGRVDINEGNTAPAHEGDSGFHRSSDMDEHDVSTALSNDFRSISTSSENDESSDKKSSRVRHPTDPNSNKSASSLEEATSPTRKDEIDPSILADIEDFQLFSRQKLAKINNNNNS
ncbi:uncharacterized protein LOC120327075 isoform X3 [Styela clava]